MIEEIILNYLSAELSVPVLMEYPEVPSEDFPTLPEQFVVIERVGGGIRNHIQSASLAFQSYGPSLYAAAALDQLVREKMSDAPELPDISGVRLSSNYNHSDSRTHQYRYQCVWDIYFV